MTSNDFSMKKIINILTLIFLFATIAQGQVILRFGTPYNYNGKIAVPLLTDNFESIISMQFSINYNPSVLDLDSIINPNNQLFGQLPNFYNVTSFDGAGIISWYDTNSDGETLPDGTDLFTLVFSGNLSAFSNEPLFITNNPTVIEITQFPGIPVTVNTIPFAFGQYGTFNGNVFQDSNNNCVRDDGEIGLSNFIVQVNGSSTHYDITNSEGEYTIFADTGTYNISLIPPATVWESCPIITGLHLANIGDSITQNLGAHAIVDCPVLEVNLSTPFLRRCSNNTYTIHYSNNGTTAGINSYILVQLDEFMTFQSASHSVTQSGQELRFDLGDVGLSESGTIQYTVYLDCDSTVLGQTHCTTANFHSDNDENCQPSLNWDGSNLNISGVCNGDSLHFNIINDGSGDMSVPTSYFVIEDDMILHTEPLQLNIGEAREIVLAATGSTYRVQADQVPNHPSVSTPSVTLEGCTENGIFTTGFVNIFSLPDADGNIDIDCQESVGSYDPNDKQGFPIGYREEHFIEKDMPLEYLIRFQNTGTDTAFTVVVRDTLSQYLDITSFSGCVTSHPYTLRIEDDNILVFYFNNIELPDSNVNEVASHGFIKFNISQRPDNSIGTLIENNAAIYFDFNPPIITNTTYHTVGENYIGTVATAIPHIENIEVTIAPNPFTNQTVFDITGEKLSKLDLVLFNAQGREIRYLPSLTNRFTFERDGLPQGIYFYRINNENGIVVSGKLIVQ